jgi:ATP/ADP translocase
MLLSHVPMSLPLTTILQQQSRVLLSALPTGTIAAAFVTAATSSTQLSLAVASDSDSTSLGNDETSTSTVPTLAAVPDSSSPSDNNNSSSNMPWPLPPRAAATIYMAVAMALHFGGYEFIRNSCLSLFTSTETGFSSAAAFPLANGLISPFSIFLLYGYSQQLQRGGPRVALRNTTLCSIFFIVTVTAALYACQHFGLPKMVSQALVGLAFLFQSSYQHLLYTQQWSFVGSVVTPDEGARWFGILAGCSSLFCSLTGSMVPKLLPSTGLLGLLGLTAVTLTGSALCADRAYAISEQYGFDPSKQRQQQESKSQKENAVPPTAQSKFSQAVELFRRVPTLGVLFAEVLSFQSLNTILNVAFVRSLKQDIVDDQMRAAYTGQFYSAINAVSAMLQFVVVPLFLKHTEPAMIWRLMPLIPLAVCLPQLIHGQLSLTLLAAAFFAAKVMDYAVRSVLYIMVYQPLDFESRYVGKEIIGIFGSRFGKSGMSLILSGLAAVGLTAQQQLGQLSLLASLTWLGSTWWLSGMLPSKKEAQAQVDRRKQGADNEPIKED